MPDDFQYVKLPDGSYGKFAGNASDEEIRGHIQSDFPTAFAPMSTVTVNPPAPRSGLQKLQDSFDANTATSPQNPALQTILQRVVGAVGAPAVHPLDTLKGVASTLGTNPDYPQLPMRVNGQLQAPEPQQNPIVDRATEALHDVQQGGMGYAGAKLAGDAIGGGILGAIPGAVAGRMASIPPSPVTAPEISARRITQAINPPNGYQNVVDAIQAHAGDVADYAKRNNIGISGKLDYSKAARGAADEALGHYKQILDPNAGVTVPVSENYQGSLARNPGQGVGRYANLTDINSRIGQINDLIRSAQEKGTEGATMTARERLGLDAEHAELTGKLHQGLADAIGTTPDNIAALRQKFGKLYTIADATNASTNAIAKTEANIDQGTRVGHPTVAGVALEAVNKLRGGPQAISDRALVGAVRNSPIQPTNVSRFLTAAALRSTSGQ